MEFEDYLGHHFATERAARRAEVSSENSPAESKAPRCGGTSRCSHTGLTV